VTASPPTKLGACPDRIFHLSNIAEAPSLIVTSAADVVNAGDFLDQPSLKRSRMRRLIEVRDTIRFDPSVFPAGR